VIADSISPYGHRLTTFEVVMHRFVLAEFNTHRVFSRNSASSRAIPLAKQLDRVLNDPAYR
jgi:thymidylate synthase ThyX